MSYVIGIDGGGTKSVMEVRTCFGDFVLRTSGGGININSMTKEEIIESVGKLMEGLNKASLENKDCNCVVIATAGVSNVETEKLLLELFRYYNFTCPVHVVGDQVGALNGAFPKKSGIILISGTGSICYGKSESNEYFRCGGYGHLIDDEGSGYAIGRDILSALIRSQDHREEKTVLWEEVLQYIGGSNIEDIIAFTYQVNGKKKIASLAPLLLKAMAVNDEIGIRICKKAAKELVSLVEGVAINFTKHKVIPISYLGGILMNFEPLRKEVDFLLNASKNNYKRMEPVGDACSGAVWLAMEYLENTNCN